MSHAGETVSIETRRSVFILNPMSGRPSGRARRRERIVDFIARHRLDSRLLETSGPGHGTALARAALAEGAGIVISVGGDGTMNEVASALVGAPACFGLVPCGSGNGLARDLGLPLEIDRALDLLRAARVREIDTGTLGGYPFFNVAGLGFDAEISRRFNRCGRRGFASYVRIGLGVLFEHRCERLTIEREGVPPETLDAYVATLANSTQFGNHARIAPRARLDDGLLDLTVVRTGNLLVAVPLGVRLFAGTIDRARAVRTMQAARFTLRRTRPGPIHTDGEVREAGAVLEARIIPRSLRVLTSVP